MTDRELLELAAKVYFPACASLEYPLDWVRDCHGEWNPLTDDGDSRRLATRLHLVVASMRGDHVRPAFSTCYHFNGPEYSSEPHGDDPDGATRLAVLRTAAAIGKALQSKSANSEAKSISLSRATSALKNGAVICPLPLSFFRGGSSYNHQITLKNGAKYVISASVFKYLKN